MTDRVIGPEARSQTASLTVPMIGVLRLARLLVRFRVRSALNAVRARPAGPFALLLVFGLASAVAYVGLFATALGTIGAQAGRAGEATALGLMTGAIALASLTAKASGEGLFAGTPENEFLLAQPLSLARLMAGRSVAGLLTDPFGTLFLLPVLLAAALAWQLPAPAALVAVATSVLAQLAISALAQTIQIATVRWVPRRRRTAVFVALRVVAAATMAAVWISATAVLRAPALFATHDAVLQRWAAAAGALAAPLLAYRSGGGPQALRALAPLLAGTAVLFAAALAIVRRAGMQGWEEAGAPWSDSATLAPDGPPLTLVRREWRLLARDRPRLVALVVLPVLLLAVQWLGAVGWSSATATLDRVAMVTFSITVYLAALGPLVHMQHERRAFWIVRALPVSVDRVMRAKVTAWAPLVGGAALLMYGALAWSLRGPERPAAAVLITGALVLGGALATTVLAVGLGCLAADLSDDQRGALGPGTVYLFLLLGGLLNVIFGAGGWDGLRIGALYLGTVGAVWRSGIEQARACLDPEAHRQTPPRLAHAAVLLLLFALVPFALDRGLRRIDVAPGAIAAAHVVVLVLLGGFAARQLRPGRADPALKTRDLSRALVIGLLCGGATRGVRQLLLGAGPPLAEALRQPPVLALLLAVALSEELVLRGAVQGAIERELLPVGRMAPWIAAVVSVGAAQLAAPTLGALSLLLALGPAVARAATGRVLAACAARVLILLAGS